jgi:hypothetical protein
MALTVPTPSDYTTPGDFHDAYDAYRRQVDAGRDAQMLATLAELGARTTDCPCGYTPFDTCPVHD